MAAGVSHPAEDIMETTIKTAFWLCVCIIGVGWWGLAVDSVHSGVCSLRGQVLGTSWERNAAGELRSAKACLAPSSTPESWHRDADGHVRKGQEQATSALR
jgi:hypothetical protein